MFNILKNLIEKKFYTTKEEAMGKVDTCYAMGKITSAQYETLIALVNEVYSE